MSNCTGEGEGREARSCFHALLGIETAPIYSLHEGNLAISSKTKTTYTLAQQFHLWEGILLKLRNEVRIRSFIAVLFVIIKERKRPKWALVGDWVNKWWHIHTMECYTPSFKRAICNYLQDTFNGERARCKIVYILNYLLCKNGGKGYYISSLLLL